MKLDSTNSEWWSYLYIWPFLNPRFHGSLVSRCDSNHIKMVKKVTRKLSLQINIQLKFLNQPSQILLDTWYSCTQSKKIISAEVFQLTAVLIVIFYLYMATYIAAWLPSTKEMSTLGIFVYIHYRPLSKPILI